MVNEKKVQCHWNEIRIDFCFVSFNPISGQNADSETVLY